TCRNGVCEPRPSVARTTCSSEVTEAAGRRRPFIAWWRAASVIRLIRLRTSRTSWSGCRANHRIDSATSCPTLGSRHIPTRDAGSLRNRQRSRYRCGRLTGLALDAYGLSGDLLSALYRQILVMIPFSNPEPIDPLLAPLAPRWV